MLQQNKLVFNLRYSKWQIILNVPVQCSIFNGDFTILISTFIICQGPNVMCLFINWFGTIKRPDIEFSAKPLNSFVNISI